MATPQKILMAVRSAEQAEKRRLKIAEQAEKDTTTLAQHKSTAQEKQPTLLILFVKVWVYAYTLPGRGVGMTNQHAKEKIDVNLVIW